MKKIPTLFLRDMKDMARVKQEVNPRCQWVIDGEGVATRKWDGTACMIDADGLFWKRRTIRKGQQASHDFISCEVDDTTGKEFGWLLVTKDDKYHNEAWGNADVRAPGTYELVGPKVQGGAEGFERHELLRHEDAPRLDAPRDYPSLKEWLKEQDIEGIVWHHPDGRMAKIKKRDFGWKR